MPNPLTPPPKSALIAAAALAVPAVLLPLVPPDQRTNFAAFGALGVFLASRGGLVWALALQLGAKLAADLVNFAQMNGDPDYLPMPSVYVGFALYALIAAPLADGRPSVCRAGWAAVLGSVAFFVATNLFAWKAMALPYQQNLAGLMESYTLALPFFQKSLLSDVGFTAALFALERVFAVATTPKPAEVAEDAR